MVRIVPLPAEDFSDQDDESQGDEAECPSHRSAAEESNLDSPIAENHDVEGRRSRASSYEERQMQPSRSRPGLIVTEESSALHSSLETPFPQESLGVQTKGVTANDHANLEENDEVIQHFTSSFHQMRYQGSTLEIEVNSAIPVVPAEERVGIEPQTEALGAQEISGTYATQGQSANLAEDCLSQTKLNIHRNSSSPNRSHFDPDSQCGESERKDGYLERSTLAAWKSPKAKCLDPDLEFIHANRVPFYQQEAFSFRQDVRTTKSVQQVSPKVSETSVSNLAYESEPETRSSADSNSDVELQGISPHLTSSYARRPKEHEDEIQEELNDNVEESFHKRLGRDDGLIDSRKVDYFPSPLAEEGEDDLGLNINSGLFVYRKRGTLGYMEPLPDDMYPRDGSGSDYSEQEQEEDAAGGHPQIVCRALDHADSLGLTKVNIRMKSLIDWLVDSFSKLLHARHESPHPLVEIIGPKVKFDRGAFVAFNLVDCKGMLLHPRFVQKVAGEKNIFLQLGFVHNFHTDRTPGVFKAFAAKTEAAHQLSGFPVLTAALGFLSNFEDVYRLWMFVSKFLDPEFVTQEKLKYDVSNQ